MYYRNKTKHQLRIHRQNKTKAKFKSINNINPRNIILKHIRKNMY